MRVFFGRIIASAVAALAVWLAASFGLIIDEESRQGLEAGGVALLTLIGQLVYGVGHKFVNRWLNPGDTASHTLAVSADATRDRLKTRPGSQ